MNIDSIIEKTLSKLRSTQWLVVYKGALPSIAHQIGEIKPKINKSDLVKLFNTETDLLRLLLRLCVLSDEETADYSSDVILTLRDVDSTVKLKTPQDLTSIFEILRDEICLQSNSLQFDSPYEFQPYQIYGIHQSYQGYQDICRLPLSFHSVVIDKLVDLAMKSDPPAVIFPGDKKGYIQLSTIPLSCISAYTFTAWIKSSHAKQETKGFVLFRCRSASGGIDVIMSDKSQDGQWQVIVRSFREMTPGTSTIFKEEVQGYVYIPPNKWHLVAIRHTKFPIKPATVAFLVDGVLEWENELSYPFSTPTDSQWIIGLGFQGQISSFSVYSDAVDTQLLKLQYDQGFYCKTLHNGIRYPQTSFDTGFTTLGSLVVKGPLALKLVKTNLIFSIDPYNFIASGELGKDSGYDLDALDNEDFNKGLPTLKSAFLSVDKIEMIPASESSSQPIIPLLSGDCRLNLEESIFDYFLAHDGSISILYLLWGYCSLLQDPISESKITTITSTSATATTTTTAVAATTRDMLSDLTMNIMKSVKSVFKLLRIVLLSSGEIREHFLQSHGFHVIASCLSRINAKAILIDEDIAHFCIDITEAFGIDSKRGDCICSALQGLFFDFRVWSNCSIPIKTVIVDAISNFTKNGGDLLYKYVGIQRVVDFLRLHIMSSDTISTGLVIPNVNANTDTAAITTVAVTSNVTRLNTNASTNTNTNTNSTDHTKKMDCVDAGYRLLLIAVESARIFYQKIKSVSSFQSIPEILLNCLDESISDLLSERLMRILYQMHSYGPQSLLRSLIQCRYSDTTVLAILSKQMYTLETRKLSLELLFWSLTEEFKGTIPQLLTLRKLIHSSKNEDLGSVSTRSRSESNPIKPDSKKTLDLSIQYSEMALPLKRVWENLTMLSLSIEESISLGYWGVHSITEAGEYVGNTIGTSYCYIVDNMDYVLDFLSFESASGSGIAPWLVLPLLPVLLSKSSLLTCQRILMSLNVSLKTDEAQVETISSFSDRQWMKFVISLAIVSEKLAPSITSDGFEVIYPEQCQQDDNRVAVTCTELALDTLSTILERKMRYSGMDAKTTWRNLYLALVTESNSLHLDSQSKQSVDKRYLKRCLALVFQRIAKSTEQWSIGLAEAIITMFSMVYNKKLCGNTILTVNHSLIHKSPIKTEKDERIERTEELINFDEDDLSPVPIKGLSIDSTLHPTIDIITSSPLKNTISYAVHSPSTPTKSQTEITYHSMQTEEESQILCFSLDILVNLRKLYTSVGFPKRELKVMKIGLALILGCIKCVSANTADRLSRDIMAQIRFMCDPNVVILSEIFNDFIVMTFSQLRSAIFDKILPEVIRDRYCALVHAILHHFHEMKGLAPPSKNSSSTTSGCVYRMKEALKHIDPNFDIASILSEIELALPMAGSTFTSLVDLDFTMSDASDGYVSIGTTVSGGSNNSNGNNSNNSNSTGNAIAITTVSSNISTVTGQMDTNVKRKMAIDLLDDNGSLAFSSSDSGLIDMVEMKHPISTTSLNNLNDHGTLSSTSEDKLPPAALWLKVRQGILADRIDTERSRLNNDIRAYFINNLATDKYWRKRRRHLEAEVFYDIHVCHWKLGISHEAQFPSRKRVVLRPSYDVQPTPKEIAYENEVNTMNDASTHGSSSSASVSVNVSTTSTSVTNTSSTLTTNKEVTKKKIHRSSEKNIMDSDEISKSLAKAFNGVIRDVTSTALPEESEEIGDNTGEDSNQTNASNTNAGAGWGLVDADGSDEGYGIVGVVAIGNDDTEMMDPTQGPSHSSHDIPGNNNSEHTPVLHSHIPLHTSYGLPTTDDMMGDVRLGEAAVNDGRRLETGPSLGGTRRVVHGPSNHQARVILITASGNIWGTLGFNDKELFFVSSLEPEDGHKDDNAAVNVSLRLRMRRRRWPISSVGAIYLRRYRLRDTALEVFFRRGKHRSFFIDFGHQKESPKKRNAFAKQLMGCTPRSAFKQWPSLPIHRLVAEHQGLQEKWMNHEISNFEYLMMLNTIAGRSYHDLCQYPVMPWVLSQYSQNSIDLSDPDNYRDLSKPMGAINPTRLSEFLSRYESFHENFGDTEIPPFMYGSHYSTMVGVVLHYLVRLEPFASLHKEMQAGHFDVSDRLFSSIPRTWTHNTTQLSEVKELTPEWYTQPNMLRNMNNYDLGSTQDGHRINEVELPPWAATPEDFIKIQCLAMESDYVSQHIHEWIDLIFGYKQQGPEAIAANNVFYYLTYYGTVNRDLIEDESLRQAIELQIAHFGQMPYQLFRQPHPARLPIKATKSVIPRPISKCFSRNMSFPYHLTQDNLISIQSSMKQWVNPTSYEEKVAICSLPIVLHRTTLSQNRHVMLNVLISNDRLCVILSNGVIEIYKYGTTEAAKQLLVVYANRMKARSSQPTKRSSNTNSGNMNMRAISEDNIGDDNLSREESTASPATIITTDDATSTLISFDDDLMIAIHGDSIPHSSSSTSLSTTTPSFSQPVNILPTTSSTSSNFSTNEIEEAVIYLSKDSTHFDIIPRIVLAKNPKYLKSISSLLGQSASNILSPVEHILKFTVANQLLLSTGFIDGRISVWELDRLTGFVQASGDYLQHRTRVVAIATDAIPNSTTDVIASIDQSGVILVWAVAKIRMASVQDDRGSSILFRHPQRLFRCWKSNSMCLDISCNIGIVTVLSHDIISIFSIERDEMLITFSVTNPTIITTTTSSSSSFPANTSVYSSTYSKLLISSETNDTTAAAGGGDGTENNDHYNMTVIPKHIALSDDGYIAINLTCKNVSSNVLSEKMDYLVVYTLSGHRCNVVQCSSKITFFDCPHHGDVLVTGQEDGSVILYAVSDLCVLFRLDVHTSAIPAIDPVFLQHMNDGSSNSNSNGNGSSSNTSSSSSSITTKAGNNTINNNSNNNNNNNSGGGTNVIDMGNIHSPKKISMSASAIVSVSLGPDPLKPAIICITTLAGDLFVRPLLDYFKWERNRSPSVLSQIVTGHIQAVKGTIQQAQNFLSSTTESASAIAQNARQYADEAIGELKKINRASIWKMFGMGKES